MCYFDTESNSLMNIELASYCGTVRCLYLEGNVLVMLELMQVLD